jgi:hypothetical protein
VDVAGKLAAAFAATGVWPLLWRFDEDPDSYMYGGGDLDAIHEIDVARTLAQRWDALTQIPAVTDPFTTFPDLAPSSPATAGDTNPFRVTEDSDSPARLLLVPCNRPADAITALGGLATATDTPLISAVLRSWEQRFEAVPIEVAPGAVTLAVLSPPHTPDQALRLAAEHYAFYTPPDSGRPSMMPIPVSATMKPR